MNEWQDFLLAEFQDSTLLQWKSGFTSLSLSLLICEMGTVLSSLACRGA